MIKYRTENFRNSFLRNYWADFNGITHGQAAYGPIPGKRFGWWSVNRDRDLGTKCVFSIVLCIKFKNFRNSFLQNYWADFNGISHGQAAYGPIPGKRFGWWSVNRDHWNKMSFSILFYIKFKIFVRVFSETTEPISRGSHLDKYPMVPYRVSALGGDRSTVTVTLGQNAFFQ